MTKKLTVIEWEWEDEIDFMRLLGPERLARYKVATKRHRKRDFAGDLAGPEFWKAFEDAAALAERKAVPHV